MDTLTERPTMADFCTRLGITSTAERVDANPHMDDSRDMDHWKVRLVKRGDGRRTMTIYFSQGYGHHGAEPTVTSVLSCLASDASGIEEPFEDWAANLGWSADSRKAERTYRICEQQAARLRRFLGETEYQVLVYETEQE